MKETTVKVGIKTGGLPQITTTHDGFTKVKNMLIGDGFHWENVMEVVLPGVVDKWSEPLKGTDGNIVGGKNHRGNLHVTLINEVPIEKYLECVVGSEMNPRAPLEFLKAHAVISRSWVAGKIAGEHVYGRGESSRLSSQNLLIGWDDNDCHQGFHVCSDDHCQRYQGLQPISKEALEAIRSTAGEILVMPKEVAGEESREFRIVDARFSKCCGGVTEKFSTCWQDIDFPELRSVECPWCNLENLEASKRNELLGAILKDYDLATHNYGYRWQTEISKAEIRDNLLHKFGRDIGEIISIEAMHRGTSGRIDLLKVEGAHGTLEIGKELWIRRLLSPSHLPSSAFEVAEDDGRLLLYGRGWGHGVGLCQIGAAHMAACGHDYRSILAFYYPGSILRAPV